MCFLPSTITSSPVLALLHIDFKFRYRILAREVDLANQELSIEPSPILPPTFVQDGASLLVPIPGSSNLLGGILVLGGGIAQFFECAPSPTGKQRRRDRSSPEHKRKRNIGSTESSESPSVRAELPFSDVAAYVTVHRLQYVTKFSKTSLCIIWGVAIRLSMKMAIEY
jgi:hypothetical protein